MEGYYKHKLTGAVQIFSDTTVEILGGESEWEYLEEFDGTQEIETVFPNTSETDGSEEQQDRVRAVDTSETQGSEDDTSKTEDQTPKVEEPKGKGKRAVTAEELDNE